ncbi:hypothetical protein F441_13349 [Phytophthora nicotianae CJ01A1]|uniref:BZIP domain-containing protein n=2 Tax=Phytophthora nicotianae TaxID=4792 RepID=W2WNG4_PHYNI|nr:hypothetical protein L915_13101 [Phytophthora nicotianae]ETP11119.1 hypothetical protein F441_13349 [Phytophthora nicotianae CJ01A1]
MDSNAAFLKDLEAFLDNSAMKDANVEFPFDALDPRLLPAGDASSNTFEVDSMAVATLPDLVANDNQTESSSSDPENQSAEATRRAKEASRRQEYRKRQRDERSKLLDEVDQLSITLRKLMKTAQNTTGRYDWATRPNRVWKNVAVAELEARERAQAENQRLVDAIKARAKLINDLSRVTRKQIARAPRPSKATRSRPCDSPLCAAFLRDLEVNYAQTDRVFEDIDFVSSTQGSWQSAHNDRDNDSAKHFFRSTKMLIPSTFESTCQEMWNIAELHAQAEDAQAYNAGKDAKNTIAVRYRISKTQTSGQTASVRPLLVLRRFAGLDKMVLVWKVLAEGEGILRGIRADESGWCRLRPSGNTTNRGTWMELYGCRTILHYVDGQLDTPTVNLFNEILHCNMVKKQDEERIVEGLQKIVLEKKLYGLISAVDYAL